MVMCVIGLESDTQVGSLAICSFYNKTNIVNTYYVFQRLCYIVFLEYLSIYLLDHYDTLSQFVLHPPLIFVTIMQYQRGVSKVHTLDTWKEIAK